MTKPFPYFCTSPTNANSTTRLYTLSKSLTNPARTGVWASPWPLTPIGSATCNTKSTNPPIHTHARAHARTHAQCTLCVPHYFLYIQLLLYRLVPLKEGKMFSVRYELNLYIRWRLILDFIDLGDRGSTVVKVLCYKWEGRWFDPR